MSKAQFKTALYYIEFYGDFILAGVALLLGWYFVAIFFMAMAVWTLVKLVNLTKNFPDLIV